MIQNPELRTLFPSPESSLVHIRSNSGVEGTVVSGDGERCGYFLRSLA